MGSAGFILREKGKNVFEETLENVKISLKRAGYIYLYEYQKGNCKGIEYECHTISVRENDTSENGFLMYIYGPDDDDSEEFDWIRKGICLNDVVFIENFSDCEEMLLNFVDEYLKICPEDIFWNELDWFYTYEDIVKIKQKEFNPYWCYENPHETK